MDSGHHLGFIDVLSNTGFKSEWHETVTDSIRATRLAPAAARSSLALLPPFAPLSLRSGDVRSGRAAAWSVQ